MNKTTLKYLQNRVASQAIGPSTLRNQGAKGVVKAAREFLQNVDIKSLTKTKKNFILELDKTTEDLRCSLPYGARHFGTARKSINIFLRDCLYNQYICNEYNLDRFQSLLEVPLDAHVANGLRKTSYKNKLPQWDAIIRLSTKDNDTFQKYAGVIASHLSCNRVDLDIYLWRKIGIDNIKNL